MCLVVLGVTVFVTGVDREILAPLTSTSWMFGWSLVMTATAAALILVALLLVAVGRETFRLA